ncbi:DoxX family protein [Methylobacterium sp. NEAU 140]|uniref:DoxX family protein n=1 Tax=Methylobacterium sp. NEAU 140 TaxID=3064945 RepID=UPI0027374207|nr:DoxX family protein [Methylobacterium sp. NEAU 140]MDP4022504.1 DoxX family protein [Methylobacterium sp. NEAU 140]
MSTTRAPITRDPTRALAADSTVEALARPLPALGRALMAAIFLVSGVGKLAAPAATIAYIQKAGLPMPEVAFAVAAAVEVVGGVLLLVGYRTRTVALVLALFTVAAALSFHTAFGDRNQWIHFLKNLAMAGGLLQVAAFGADAFSVDAQRGRV